MSSLTSRLRRRIQGALRPAASRLAPRRADLPPSTWRLSRDATGALTLDGVRLTDMTARHGSPLFVVDAARLDANAAAFLRVPQGAAAGLEVYYSYKTNPVPAVLARLHERGVGAEVISEYELWLARRLGLTGDRIVLNGPGRSPGALRAAVELGALVQVNHREEIAPLAAIARGVGKRCRVGLRVVPSSGWGGQFGEPIGDVALGCYRELGRHPELEVVALHAHVGGELSTAEAVQALASELLDLWGRLRAELGLSLQILDLGGSLACRTVNHHSARDLRLNRALGTDLRPRDPDTVLGIEGYVREIVTTVEARCSHEGWARPRIFVEPGRAMTSDTQILLCSVTGLKGSGAGGLVHAILDAGVNLAEAVRGEYHQIYRAGADHGLGDRAYRLVGPICTPMDTLAWSWRLPVLAEGDVLAILDAGAYFVPFSTSFSFPQPGIAWMDHGELTLVRRAETFDDLVKRDLGPTSRA